MPRQTKEHSEATRNRILECAKNSFETSGYNATTLAKICKDAGVTKGALFHHFDSKEDLFRQVWLMVQVHMDRAAANAVIRFVDSPDPYLGFLAGCRVYLEFASDPKHQRVVNIDGQVVLGMDEWSKLDSEMGLRNVGGGLRLLIAQGLLPEESHKAMTIIIYGALTGASLALMRGSPRVTIEEILDTIGNILRAAHPEKATISAE